MKQQHDSVLFEALSEQMLEIENISRGTMMGFPCLRCDGDFFASADHKTGDLIVKLPAERVQELIGEGTGQPFAPAGRTFREWVLITGRDSRRWKKLLHEALEFVFGEQ